MSNSSAPNSGSKADWVLTQSALHRLLTWLDGEAESGGQSYLEIRDRLVLFFDRKNCSSPEDLADETLNRVARRLEEEDGIECDTPAHYCYIVARFVFLESLRQSHPHQLSDHHAPAMQDSPEEKQVEEQRSECLAKCIHELPREEQTLIINYYQGEQRAKINHRRTMAQELGLTMNALSIRACRIRARLELCMRKCLRNHE